MTQPCWRAAIAASGVVVLQTFGMWRATSPGGEVVEERVDHLGGNGAAERGGPAGEVGVPVVGEPQGEHRLVGLVSRVGDDADRLDELEHPAGQPVHGCDGTQRGERRRRRATPYEGRRRSAWQHVRMPEHRIPSEAEAGSSDVDAITAVVTEYFQSWFLGDAARMRSVLHPDLSKRTPVQPGGPETGAWRKTPLRRWWRVQAEDRVLQYEHWQDVEVLHVSAEIATAMVHSQPFVEYIHLARFADRWLIVNTLYLDNADET